MVLHWAIEGRFALDLAQELLSPRRGAKPYLGRSCEALVVVVWYQVLDLEGSKFETGESRGNMGQHRSKAERRADATETKAFLQ